MLLAHSIYSSAVAFLAWLSCPYCAVFSLSPRLPYLTHALALSPVLVVFCRLLFSPPASSFPRSLIATLAPGLRALTLPLSFCVSVFFCFGLRFLSSGSHISLRISSPLSFSSLCHHCSFRSLSPLQLCPLLFHPFLCILLTCFLCGFRLPPLRLFVPHTVACFLPASDSSCYLLPLSLPVLRSLLRSLTLNSDFSLPCRFPSLLLTLSPRALFPFCSSPVLARRQSFSWSHPLRFASHRSPSFVARPHITLSFTVGLLFRYIADAPVFTPFFPLPPPLVAPFVHDSFAYSPVGPQFPLCYSSPFCSLYSSSLRLLAIHLARPCPGRLALPPTLSHTLSRCFLSRPCVPLAHHSLLFCAFLQLSLSSLLTFSYRPSPSYLFDSLTRSPHWPRASCSVLPFRPGFSVWPAVAVGGHSSLSHHFFPAPSLSSALCFLSPYHPHLLRPFALSVSVTTLAAPLALRGPPPNFALPTAHIGALTHSHVLFSHIYHLFALCSLASSYLFCPPSSLSHTTCHATLPPPNCAHHPFRLFTLPLALHSLTATHPPTPPRAPLSWLFLPLCSPPACAFLCPLSSNASLVLHSLHHRPRLLRRHFTLFVPACLSPLRDSRSSSLSSPPCHQLSWLPCFALQCSSPLSSVHIAALFFARSSSTLRTASFASLVFYLWFSCYVLCFCSTPSCVCLSTWLLVQ